LFLAFEILQKKSSRLSLGESGVARLTMKNVTRLSKFADITFGRFLRKFLMAGLREIYSLNLLILGWGYDRLRSLRRRW